MAETTETPLRESERLYLKANDARQAKLRLDEEYRARKDELMVPVREAERKAREQVTAEFEARYQVAYQAVADAEAALDAARIAEQTAAQPYPVGTKLYQWESSGRRSYSAAPSGPRLTGKVGLFEIWTKDSVAPENMKYGKPRPGAYVVRTLRKDGTTGPSFVLYSSRQSGTWLPEGQKPKAEPA
jgi:hypothetical protein